MKTTTFPDWNDWSAGFSPIAVLWLMLAALIAGLMTGGELMHIHDTPPKAFISIEATAYGTAENKGVTITYWKDGYPIGTSAYVQSAVCRNLCAADSITIKTPWP